MVDSGLSETANDINPARLSGVIETFPMPTDRSADAAGLRQCIRVLSETVKVPPERRRIFTPTGGRLPNGPILRLKPGQTCHDYACGSAGLSSLQLVARELDPTAKVPLQTARPGCSEFAVAEMNATIHDMDNESAPRRHHHQSLSSDRFGRLTTWTWLLRT